MQAFTKGDRPWISGGYDLALKWLGGSEGHFATVVGFWPGQNSKDSLLVELDNGLKFDEKEGKYLVLELRYKGAVWGDTETVHLELLSEIPEFKKWQYRNQGTWIESHATYKRLKA